MIIFESMVASNLLSRSQSPVTLTQLKDSCTEAVVVGSGPTTFDYSELSRFQTVPVFFINQMHQISHLCPSPNKYFFTHHISEYSEVAPITVWVRRMYLSQHSYTGYIETSVKPKNKFLSIDCQADDSVVHEQFFKCYPWLLDKDEIIRRNRFLALFGTITTTIHFAWFCGAKKITFIGCNPYSGSVDHDSRVGGKMIYSPDMVHKNTLLLPQALKLKVEHL